MLPVRFPTGDKNTKNRPLWAPPGPPWAPGPYGALGPMGPYGPLEADRRPPAAGRRRPPTAILAYEVASSRPPTAILAYELARSRPHPPHRHKNVPNPTFAIGLLPIYRLVENAPSEIPYRG